MKAIGVQQLKERLAEYLRLVKQGETILVTDRDEVVAELPPARTNGAPTDDLSGVLKHLAESGVLTLPSLPKAGWTWQPRGIGLAPGTATRILDDVRTER